MASKDQQRIGAVVLIVAAFACSAISAMLNIPALMALCVMLGLGGGFLLRLGTRH
jgi:hypothetical protein